MDDLISYLQAQIDNNQHALTLEHNRERGVNWQLVRNLNLEQENLRKWINELKSVRVDSSGMIDDPVGGYFGEGVEE